MLDVAGSASRSLYSAAIGYHQPTTRPAVAEPRGSLKSLAFLGRERPQQPRVGVRLPDDDDARPRGGEEQLAPSTRSGVRHLP